MQSKGMAERHTILLFGRVLLLIVAFGIILLLLLLLL